jgi:hypothetical protein
MTRTIKSETSDTHYFLTIENGQATDCSCPSRQWRKGACKHMNHFQAEVARAAAFLSLKSRIAQAEREARTAHRLAFEISMGIN